MGRRAQIICKICVYDSQALLARGAKVYIAGRSQQKAEEAMVILRQSTEKADVHFLKLGLADLQAVKKAAETFLRWLRCFYFRPLFMLYPASLEKQLRVLFENGRAKRKAA
jgi:NAD(P)-dependent dehydrogenase (short-subunit alcohol dehydrogenase family)